MFGCVLDELDMVRPLYRVGQGGANDRSGLEGSWVNPRGCFRSDEGLAIKCHRAHLCKHLWSRVQV